MDFSISNSDSWDTTPSQEQFIKSYFQKRKNFEVERKKKKMKVDNYLLNPNCKNHDFSKLNEPAVTSNKKSDSIAIHVGKKKEISDAFIKSTNKKTSQNGNVESTLNHNLNTSSLGSEESIPKEIKKINKKSKKSVINEDIKNKSELLLCKNISEKNKRKRKKLSKESENSISSHELELNKSIQSKMLFDNNSQECTFFKNIKNVPKEDISACNNNETQLHRTALKHHTNVTSDSKISSFRKKAQEKLEAAKFRYLNEKLYTETGKEAFDYFQKNVEDFRKYHKGYNIQVSKWPINPVDVIISDLQKMQKSTIVADMGCGDAKIAQTFTYWTVYSFDLVALNNYVISCDISKVPLPNTSVDVVVFCLSLMGTNLKDYLCEAHRVLKLGGILKIAEVESRIENLDYFIKNLLKFGFSLQKKDISHKMFIFLDFQKVKKKLKKANVSDVTLKPCLYKKR